jgi:Glycosyl transferases group 1
MSERKFDRVFVVGAYLPNGGTLMAYHLGRILDREFGIPAIAVTLGGENADLGIHNYDLRMPSVSVAQMEQQITERDILVVNPSFSTHQFGWRLPGFKLCYVQDFKTFALLDRKFDHYVAVSDFVGAFLRTVYDLDVSVIPPFINLDAMPPATPWLQRPPSLVLPYHKGMPQVWELSFARVRELLAQRAPQITLAEPLAASGVAQRELFARVGAVRYLLTLSAAEGFGLVPLEAMAMGTAVVGYDAFGGRHYMRSGENCFVAPYPQIDRVVDMLIGAVNAPERSAHVARRGCETAQSYSYANFRQRWVDELSRALAQTPLR